jgi:hypothetical protein
MTYAFARSGRSKRSKASGAEDIFKSAQVPHEQQEFCPDKKRVEI